MIKRVISLIALILLNSSCLTFCVGSEQTPPRQTTTTAPTQSQRDKQNFEKLLADFKEKEQEQISIKKNICHVKSLNSNVKPVIYGLISAGISGGICYLKKQPRLKIGLYSAAFGLTALLGTKVIQWFSRRMNPKLNDLKRKKRKRTATLATLEEGIMKYFGKFDLPYINGIHTGEKQGLLPKVISRLIPKVKNK